MVGIEVYVQLQVGYLHIFVHNLDVVKIDFG